MTKLVLSLATLVVGLVPTFAQAQTPYIVSVTQGTYAPIAGGTTHVPVAYDAFSNWDEGVATIALPFPFSWYGTDYNTIYAFTNGFVSFSPAPAFPGVLSAPGVVPSNLDDVSNFIGVMWMDLDQGVNAAIRTLTTGAVGNRVFTIQYENLRTFNAVQSSVNFQIKLFEGSDQVQITMGTNFGGLNGSTVMENANGTEGQSLLATCGPADCSSTEWPIGLTITIALPAGPELVGSIMVPSGGYPATTFDADLTIRNIGLSPTAAFDYQVVFSSSNTSTAGAMTLGSYSQAAIPASGSVNVTRTLTVPAVPVGTFYVALLLDTGNDVVETLENNNHIFSTPFATGPDLVGTLTAPAQTGPGEPLDVLLSLDSRGAPVAAPVRLAFFLSTDQVKDAGDTPLGTRTLTLPDGFSYSGTQTLTVPANQPASPPNYFVLAVIDDNFAVTETNETNNLLISGSSLEVRFADLEVPTIVAGPFAFRGQPYPVSTRIENTGGAIAAGFKLCIFLSDNLLISVVTDTRIAEISPLTLAPGESRSVELQPVIDVGTSTGTYYVAAVIDCDTQIAEVNEPNNIRRRPDAIVVRDPAPDFVPIEISTASAAAAGEAIPVSVRFANLGNLTGDTQVRLVISSDPSIGPEDTVIYDTTTAFTLAPPTERTLAVWGELPGDLPSGNYYVGAILDPGGLVDEVYESNNTLGRGPVAVTGANLAIVSPNPPNPIIGAPYVVRFHAVGGAAGYTWSITWDEGSAPAGLSFNAATAEISGEPQASAEGRHGFTLAVTSGNLTATKAYSVLVTPPTLPLTIVSSRLPPAVAGETYSVQLVAVGGAPPYRWRLSSNPPVGVGVSPDGELAGQPQLVGSSNFTVQVTDLDGASVEATLSLDIVDPTAAISITTPDVIASPVGIPYDVVFEVSGGTAPYRWRLEGDVPGLHFDSNPTAPALTGTPTVAGTFPITVEVRDADGLLDRNAYVVEILPAGQLRITTGQTADSQLPKGKVGTSYLGTDGGPVRLRAIPQEGVIWSVADGSLPPGLTLDINTGEIIGTPTTEGAFPFIVLARNAANDLRRATLVIVIEAADVQLNPMNGDDGCSCTAAHQRSSSAALMGLLLVGLLFRRKKWLAPIVALTMVSGVAQAQPVPYQVIQEDVPYVGLGAAGTEMIPGLGDGSTSSIPLPFDVILYGESFDSIYVNANGLIAVTNILQGNHNPPLANPSPFAPNGFIAGLWDDWCVSVNQCFGATRPGMGVFYQIDNTPGDGSVTVEYRRIVHFFDGVTPSDVSFKITLREGLASQIELSYGVITAGSDFGGFPTPFDARIGLESADGLYGMWVAPCSGTSGCSATDAAFLTNKRITLIADAGEDLAAANVAVPIVGYPGLPIAISGRAISRHQNPLGPVDYAAYLISSTATSTQGGWLIYQGGPLSFTPFESKALSFDAEIPNDVPAGQYRVALVVDSAGALVETSEENNASISSRTIRITDRAPDFRIISLTPLDRTLAPGDTLDVDYRLQNAGNEPGLLVARAVLSTNEAITISDLPLGNQISIQTASRETISGTLSAVIPASIQTGEYFVGMIVDPDFAVAELQESNNAAHATEAVTIASSQVAVLTDTLPVATLGRPYSAVISAAGGNGVFTYSLTSGALPTGLSFDLASAEIHGIPLAAGSFALEVEAQSANVSGRRTLTLDVVDPAYGLTVVTHTLPVAVLGEDYSVPLLAVGGLAPYAWRIADGNLPPGIVLGPDGVLTGSPSEVGYRPFLAQVRDNASVTATVGLGIEVRSPTNLTIVSSSLPAGAIGEPYTQQLRAYGGIGTLIWSNLNPLPPGLDLSDDGLLGGIPEEVGMSHFQVEVTDARGNRDTNLMFVDVRESGRFQIVNVALPPGAPGERYHVVVKAEGGSQPYQWSAVVGEGYLPPDFLAVQSSGIAQGETTDDYVVSGPLPAQPGVWAFTLHVEDAQGRVDERAFAIVSQSPAPPPVIVDEGGCSCSTEGRGRTGASGFGLLLAFGALLRRRARWLVLPALLLASSSASAQTTAPYFRNQYAQTYTPIVGGTVVTPNSTDDGEALVPIGFNFEFYGVVYDTVSVGVNGALTFATACTTSAQCDSFSTCSGTRCLNEVPYSLSPVPDPQSPNRIVEAWMDDLDLFVSGNITYALLGSAPTRELVVQWSNIGHHAGGTTTANFQIHLVEGAGAIRVAYGPVNIGTSPGNWSGNLGIENATGSEGVAGLPCAAGINGCVIADLQSLSGQVLEYVGALGAELVVSGVAPTGGEVGATVSIDVTARNIGLMPTGAAFTAEVYFSVDGTIDATDTLLGTVNFAAQAELSSITHSLDVVVPNVAAGYYTIGAIIDPSNAITEDFETNNASSFRTDFLVGTDLSIGVASPPASGPNEPIEVPVTLINYGAAQTGVLVYLYFSANQTLDAADTLIGTATVAVPAAPSTPIMVPATIPNILPGDYYTIAVIDPLSRIVEASELNNLGVSAGTSELTGPDLAVTNPDTSAEFLFRGEPFEVTGLMSNQGGATARGFYYAFYLSTNQLINIFSDPQVVEVGPIDLAPGANNTVTAIGIVPNNLPTGAYYLGFVVNTRSNVLEQVPNNNTSHTTRTIMVRDPAPDFTMARIRVPMTAAAGESMVVERIVANNGNAPGTADYQLFLSVDTTIDPATDVPIGTGQSTIAAQSEDSDTDQVLIPATVAPGNYYVGYLLDGANAVEELYENNNAIASTTRVNVLPNQLQILNQGLPIGVVDAPFEVIFAASGGAGAITWSVLDGDLAPGLVLESDGRLHGSPTEEGPFHFTVQATDGAARAEKAFDLLIATETLPLEVASASLQPGFVGRPYEYPVVAFGGITPYTWRASGDPLPGGVTFSADGLFSGVPTTPVLANIVVRVTDAVGSFAEKRLVFRVVTGGDSVRLANDVLPDGALGETYDEELRVAQNTGASPFGFEVASGELPPGLLLEGARLTGVPERVGQFELTIRVTDSRGDFDLNRYLVSITEGEGVTFVTTSLPDGLLDAPYVDGSGNPIILRSVSPGADGAITYSLVAGELPPGLQLGSDGRVTGAPTSVGVYSFTALAVDPVGQFDVRAYGIVVVAPLVEQPPFNADDGCSCTATEHGRASALGLGLLLFLIFFRRRFGLLFGAAVLFTAASAQAQSGVYMNTTESQPYVARSGGTTLSYTNDDNSSLPITLPFPFHFFDQDFTTVQVATNGYVTFGTEGGDDGNDILPSLAEPDNMIAMFWDDWDGTTTTSWFLEGTAPNRVVIIQYTVGTRWLATGGGSPQLQLWLFEGPSARFEMHYGGVTGMSNPAVWNATIGYQDESGQGAMFLTCSPNCDGNAVDGLDGTVFKAQQDGGTDVIAGTISIPAEIFGGVPFTTNVTLISPHGNPIGPFVYQIHLLAPGETIPNRPIYTSAPVVLNPYQTLASTATPAVALSTPSGAYRLALVVDAHDDVPEPNESNNVAISASTARIGQPLADFDITSVSSNVPGATPGGAVTVFVALHNGGNLDGSANWDLLLSRNQVISADDLLLHSGTTSLPLLSTETATVDLSLPADLAPGRYYFGAIVDPDNDVEELLEINNSGVATGSFEVRAGGVGIATTTLPSAYVGQDYSIFLTGTGGDGTYAWRLVSGTLPAGLSLLTTGEIRGRPTAIGVASLELEVTSAGQTFSATLMLEVAELDGGLTIVTRQLLPGVVGASYPPAPVGTPLEQQPRLVAVGGQGTVEWSLVSTAPPGLQLQADGLLFGVPTQSGVFDVTVAATDGTQTAMRAMRLTVAQPGRLTLVALDLPNGRIGEDYNILLSVVGRTDTATVTFTTANPMPPGLALTTEGRIVGLPQTVGVWTFSVEVTENSASAGRDSAGFRIQVDADAGFGITPAMLPAATLGEDYEATFEARQGRPPFTWRVSGPPLPRGLIWEVVEVMGVSKLLFSGIPEEVGAVSVLISLVDNDGRDAELPVTMLVNPKPTPPIVPVEPEGCQCRSSGQTTGSFIGLALLGLLLFSRPSRRRAE